jgi:hypothetical protein
LRRLGHYGIADAVFGVEPEVRRGLRATGKRDEQILRHIARLESRLHRLGAIDLKIDRRCITRLVNLQVDEARHAAQPLQQVLRDPAIGGEIIAGHLNVNRRGQAEIQDLADDVGRRE